MTQAEPPPKICAHVCGDAGLIEEWFPYVLLGNKTMQLRFQHPEDAAQMLADYADGKPGLAMYATLEWLHG